MKLKNKKSSEINKKIMESKKIIKEEKDKIRKEKRNERKKRYAKFKDTKFGKFWHKICSFFRIDKDAYSFSEVFVITLFSLVVGTLACFSVLLIISDGKNYFKLSKDLNKLVDVYETLVDNYKDDINKDELIDSAINGMVSSLGDSYTSYVDSTNTEEFDELVSGVYEGIGCTIQLQKDGLKIIQVFDDSPADKAGLQIDDIILKVDDQDVSIEKITDSYDVNELANYIKKESAGKIVMVVERDGEEKVLRITRAMVETPVVSGKIYEVEDKKIGYLEISVFSSVSYKQFKSELDELEEVGIDGLVIDVRGNNGGYLTTVTDIASYLLPKGEVIYQVEKNNKIEVTKDKTLAYRSYPIAVLVNGLSASASEILAAAIKDSYGGYVVGTKTYGKGTVQQVKKLDDGSMIKYTVEDWLTPNGEWINDNGIEPTNVEVMDGVYYEYPTDDNDNQLKKALELISK